MKNPHVLVVDDESTITDILSQSIRLELGWAVSAFNSPRKALAELKSRRRWFGYGKHPFDCIIVDIKMPEMNSFELIQAWRKIEGRFQIPVVILSAYEDERKWKQSTHPAMGTIAGYLKKPVRQAELFKTLQRIVLQKEGEKMQSELLHKSYERYHELRSSIEYKIAHEMQQSLLPDIPDDIEPLAIHTVFKPAAHVGGDYYDFFRLTPTKLGIVIVDIIGKGVPACIAMIRFRELIHRYIDPEASPKDFVARLNELICKDKSFKKGAPIFYGVIDTVENTLTYVNTIGNAGGIHVSSGGKATFLDVGGFMIGALPDEQYEEATVSLHANDQLLFFTDGITEQSNGTEAQFGIERLMERMEGFNSGKMGALAEYVCGEVQRFSAGTGQEDDMTVISVGVKEG